MPRIPSFKILAAAATVGSAAGLIYFHDPRASAYKKVVMPLGRWAVPNAETAHNLTIKFFQVPYLCPALPAKWLETVDPAKTLQKTIFSKSENDKRDPRVRSLKLNTPIGIAAGFDKAGKVIDPLFNMGYSWVEIGSMTPLPQPGNAKPRCFRLIEDRAIINRFGFNSEGHAAIKARISKRSPSVQHKEGQILAVNLGKNKHGNESEDYALGIQNFGELADALVVNVSSPNTPGLRDLQGEGKLNHLLTHLVQERNKLKLAELPPLLVKIAPDLDDKQIKSIAAAVKSSGIDGVIVGNTTISRPVTLKSDPKLTKETGGLSGPPLKNMELKVLKSLRELVGPDLTIVGSGGVTTSQDVLDFANAGADLVQLYTAFAYDGPGVGALITEDLLKQLNGAKWSDVTRR